MKKNPLPLTERIKECDEKTVRFLCADMRSVARVLMVTGLPEGSIALRRRANRYERALELVPHQDCQEHDLVEWLGVVWCKKCYAMPELEVVTLLSEV